MGERTIKTGPTRIRDEIQKNSTECELEKLLLALWDHELDVQMRYKERYKSLINECAEKRYNRTREE